MADAGEIGSVVEVIGGIVKVTSHKVRRDPLTVQIRKQFEVLHGLATKLKEELRMKDEEP